MLDIAMKMIFQIQTKLNLAPIQTQVKFVKRIGFKISFSWQSQAKAPILAQICFYLITADQSSFPTKGNTFFLSCDLFVRSINSVL